MRITITVPKAINRDNAPVLDTHDELPAHVLTKVKQSTAKHFGGFTAYEADGGWIDDDGNLVEEPVTVVETYVPDNMAHIVAQKRARVIAAYVRSALYQDAAMYTVNNEARFV